MSPATPAKENENDLILRACQGDREAYGALVVANQPAIFTLVYRMTGHPDLAEDATQQAFVNAWLHLPEYRPGSSLRAWLGRIAINASLDMLRREKRILPEQDGWAERPDPAPGPEHVLIEKEAAHAVERALMLLSEHNRSVLVLREYGGMSYQEIATSLNIPLGTVMSRLNTARSQLRAILQPMLAAAEVEYG